MELLLVRHAIAEVRDASRWPDDSARPLSADGARRFRPAARGLRMLVPSVDAVLASPYVRAWQTAELLCDEIGWPAPERCDELAAPAGPDAPIAAVRERQAEQPVVLVGHEPNLSCLASLLLTGSANAAELELKKGGAVLLASTAAPSPATAVLRWSVPPRVLRRLADDG